MESKLSDIFTTYANADIKNNPQVFLKIKNIFKKNVRSKANLDRLNMIIKYFVILTKIDNLEKAEAIYNKFINKKFITMKGQVKFRHSFKIAFDGIYGYRNNYCEDGFCTTAYNHI